MGKDDAFIDLVDNAALAKNCEFFVFSGEGREFETDSIAGEDLFGWLIPKNKVAEFQKEFKDDTVSDQWDDFQCFAIWNMHGNTVSVEFKQMN